jgi:hypothetical protein
MNLRSPPILVRGLALFGPQRSRQRLVSRLLRLLTALLALLGSLPQ